jgi:hypothetical protein
MKASAILFVIFLNLIGFNSTGQRYEGQLTTAEKSNFETVKNAIKYLKDDKTRSFLPIDSSSVKVLIKGYADFLERFYDIHYLIDSSEKQTIMSLEGQALLVYNIDHYLDVLPLDSIFVSPLAFFHPKEAEGDFAHSLVTYFKINGRTFHVQSILFNNAGKIKALAPYIDFERNNKGIDIQGFYNRQKGYEQIKDKLYKFF